MNNPTNLDIMTAINENTQATKDLKQELRGLIEIQQRLIHERLGVPTPPPPVEYGEDKPKKTNIMKIADFNEGRIGISGGSTFDYKTVIKTAGCNKWDPPSKTWTGPRSCLNKLIQDLESLDLKKDQDFLMDVKSEDTPEEPEGFGAGF
jgi:hypothetical protein